MTIPEKIIEHAARTAHEANREYCISIGDLSQLPWAQAPAWQRESAITGVLAVAENPAITPRTLHDRWTAAKLADGWTYGAVKDPEAKTHPCLLPYEQLPGEQRRKDSLFRDTVLRVLGAYLADPVPAPEPDPAPQMKIGAPLDLVAGRTSNVATFLEEERRRRLGDNPGPQGRPDVGALVGATHIDHTTKD